MKKLFHITVVAILFVNGDTAVAQNKDDRIKAIEDQINALKAQLDQIKNDNAKPDWLEQADNRGLTLNFYGEAKWNVKNGADFGDPHRFVLIPDVK